MLNNDKIRGPLSHFLETDGVSSGLAGAFSTEKRLLDEGYTPIHIDLPRLSTAKVDLDDYLSSGLADYIPLFPGLGVIDADYDEATSPASPPTKAMTG